MNGLSALQKSMLKRAYENRITERLEEKRNNPNYPPTPDLFSHEVLWHEYGFSEYDIHEGRYLRGGGWHRFDKQAIGDKRYRSAQAAVSRARKNLAKRGLVTLQNDPSFAGCNLTQEGIDTAKLLTLSD